MKAVKIAAVCALALTSTGCATTSFAPPVVNLKNSTTFTPQTASGKTTAVAINSCLAQIEPTNTGIGENVEGARNLIDNFIYVYRCQAHSVANGRQRFEVPAILVAAGTVTALALGAGPDVAIIGGATGATLANTKGYFDPQRKAEIYDHALDALLCIKTEAVGITAFEATANNLKSTLLNQSPPPITVSVDKQYFDMVSAALFSVERILAQRLNTTGSFDPAGAVAEIKAIQAEIEAAEEAKKPKPPPAETPPDDANTEQQSESTESDTGDKPEQTEEQKQAQAAAARLDEKAMKLLAFIAETQSSAREVELELNLIRPKLQECVVRAKL